MLWLVLTLVTTEWEIMLCVVRLSRLGVQCLTNVLLLVPSRTLFLVWVVLDSRTLARVSLAGRNRMNLTLLSRRLVVKAKVTLLLARL